MNTIVENKIMALKNFDDRIATSLSENKNGCIECLVNVLGDGILLCNVEGEIFEANNAACGMYGYTKEEFANLNLRSLFTNGLLESFHSILNESFDLSDNFAGGINVRKNGSLFPVDVRARSINVAGEKKLLVYVKDITYRRNKELELKEAKEKAEEMNKLKSAFLSNMSHELRTPMIGILGYAKMLAEEIGEPRLKEMAEIIFKSGNRLTEILNTILDLSKIESNQVQINYKNVKPAVIINEVLNLYELSAREKKLYLEADIETEGITALLDETIFFQVLSNLINNAVKYTHAGGVTIQLKKELRGNQYYVITNIIDTGIGIQKKYRDKIFEPFRQESEGLNRKYEGTGLGLTIAKKLTKLLNGEIKVESEIGKGSTFTVTFPVENSLNNIDHNNKDAMSCADNLSNKIPKVLIVEDDEITRDILKIFLKDISIIDGVSSGEEALELVEEKNYDIILMDINLKGMNGLETISKIRKIKGYEKTPIVAVTAYAMPEDKKRFLSQGCTHYISKPFFKNDLIDLLTEILPSVTKQK